MENEGLVPGAIESWETEMVLPRIWKCGAALENISGAAAEREAETIRLPPRFMEVVSNAGMHFYHTAMYSAPGRRLPYLGSTVCNILRFAQT